MKEYICSVLQDLGISYESMSHAPIMTVAEGTEIASSLGVISCKNLFLVNKQKEYFLYLLPGDKKLSAKSLAKQIGSSHLSFASREEMEQLLSTSPGAVSILGLINDREKKVRLLIDEDVMNMDYISCHPCVNTSSLRLRLTDILNILLPSIGHQTYQVIYKNDNNSQHHQCYSI